jgi:hypothetical protein
VLFYIRSTINAQQISTHPSVGTSHTILNSESQYSSLRTAPTPTAPALHCILEPGPPTPSRIRVSQVYMLCSYPIPSYPTLPHTPFICMYTPASRLVRRCEYRNIDRFP